MATINLQSLVLPALIYLLARPRTPVIPDTDPGDEYDYIIVGSGAGGSVVANRLSKDPSIKVLLIEAGGKDNITTEVPALAYMLQKSEYDWQYKTNSQKHGCLGMVNQQCPVSAGKVVGGSTSISVLPVSRGNKHDYDEWENLGNKNWSFDDLLPYFKSSENYLINASCTETKYHGCNGEITLMHQTDLQPAVEVFGKSMSDLGLSEIDFNGEQQIGYSTRVMYAIKDGIRVSTAQGYLKNILPRDNLHISLNTFVHKILIDPETKIAIGVMLEKAGIMHKVKAKREVILSAGAIGSPKILMLSGIGPKEHLEELKIPVVADLPGVGQNLKQHSGVLWPFGVKRNLSRFEFGILESTSFSKWGKGKGPLTSPSGIEGLAYVKTKYANDSRPDIQMNFNDFPLLSLITHFIKRASGVMEDVFDLALGPFVDKPYVFIRETLLNPKSKGFVKLKTIDAHDQPEIDINILSEKEDLEALLEGSKFVIKMNNTSQFQKLGYNLESVDVKQCRKFVPFSDDFIRCYLKHIPVFEHDYCCTNKMGPDSDSMAVVDDRLRVKGVSNLRVVDASIMPTIVRGNLMIPTVMIGEKGAAMIQEDNKQ